MLGADVEVDELAVQLEAPLAGRLGAELGADGEHDVGVAQELLERGLVAAGADGQRVRVGQRAAAHVGGADRRVEPLGERPQLGLRAGPQHAAAGPQHGPLGAREQLGGAGDGAVRRGLRRRGRGVEGVGHGHVRRALQDVDGHLDHHRPLRRGRGQRGRPGPARAAGSRRSAPAARPSSAAGRRRSGAAARAGSRGPGR